jgi:uroporphyrinogen-III decarboxylase
MPVNSQERIRRALAGLPVDRTPVAPAYLDLYLDELIQRHYLHAYERKLGGADSCPIDHAEDSRFRVEAVIKAYDVFHEKPDWMHVIYGETRRWAEEGSVCRKDGRLFYVNRPCSEEYDMLASHEADCPAIMRYIHPFASTADRWDDAEPLRSQADVDAVVKIRSAAELEEEGVFEPARMLVERLGAEMYLRCESGTPFWSTYTVMGFMRMMTAMHDDPALFEYLMVQKHTQRFEALKGFAHAGVHGVWLEECLSSADLISERDYLRFVFPTSQAYIKDIRELGMEIVLYYCGDSLPRLKHLCRLPISALAVEESKKGFTVGIEDVVTGVEGACCVFGNLDAVGVVHDGARVDIEQEVWRQVRAGRQARGFVLCQGSPFPLDTPPQKVDLFTLAARAAF